MGLRQTDLAQRVATTGGYISLIERGLRVPTLTLLERICEALDVPIALLFLLAEGSERTGIDAAVRSRVSKELLRLLAGCSTANKDKPTSAE